MNDKNQQPKELKAKSLTNLSSSTPKLTVAEIVKKFVNPSSHRKMIQLSAPNSSKKK